MAARYEIILKDQTGVVVARLNDWIRLKFSRYVNTYGDHKLVINELDPTASLFNLDSQVEVYRWDYDNRINRYKEYEGFHRTEWTKKDERNQSTYLSAGVGYEHLLSRRIIQNYFNTARTGKSGVAETVMKEYVDEQAGPGATVVAGRLFEDGVTSGLTIAADLARGPNWQGSKSYRNLLEVLLEIATDTDMAQKVVGTGAATFEYQAYPLPYGVDRTITGLDTVTGLNASGNRPVIFSDTLGTATEPELQYSRIHEANRCLVMGRGSEDERTLSHVIATPDTSTDSPWNLIEVAAQDQQQDDATSLTDKGEAKLLLLRPRHTFKFKILQLASLLYGRDYFLGDQVTCRIGKEEFTRTIVGVSISVEGRQGNYSESIEIEFSETLSSEEPHKSAVQATTERIRDLESQDTRVAADLWGDIYHPSGYGNGTLTVHDRHAVYQLTAGQVCYMDNIIMPRNFANLEEAILIYIPTGTGTWDYTLASAGGECSEDESEHTDFITDDGESVTDDRLECLDITALFTLYKAGDIIGVKVTCDALSTTTAINIIGIRLK